MTREEFEKKKQWLNRYKKNKRILNNLREKLYVLENHLSSAKTVVYSDLPKVRSTKTINDYLSEKESLENRICNFEKKERVLYTEIIEKIDELQEWISVEVLEEFFIQDKNYFEIAEALGYSERHIMRVFNKAIEEINITMDFD